MNGSENTIIAILLILCIIFGISYFSLKSDYNRMQNTIEEMRGLAYAAQKELAIFGDYVEDAVDYLREIMDLAAQFE